MDKRHTHTHTQQTRAVIFDIYVKYGLSEYLKIEEIKLRKAFILYLDANNLYGWAMSQPSPVGGFSWMRTMPTEKQIMSWQVNRKTGFILEVDLEYPQELHDYPLAPETTQVPGDWYSPYQQALARELGLTKDKTEKLLLTLRDKEKYVSTTATSSST